jgi:hypothetical protein
LHRGGAGSARKLEPDPVRGANITTSITARSASSRASRKIMAIGRCLVYNRLNTNRFMPTLLQALLRGLRPLPR